MTLQKSTLQAALLNIFQSAQGGSKTQAQVAQELADAIDAYLKTATVSVNTPAGPGTGSLS